MLLLRASVMRAASSAMKGTYEDFPVVCRERSHRDRFGLCRVMYDRDLDLLLINHC